MTGREGSLGSLMNPRGSGGRLILRALLPAVWGLAGGWASAADPVVLEAEAARIRLLEQASRAAVCILEPGGAGGGSGVIIDPQGLGLTNFHVIEPLLEKGGGIGALDTGRRYPLEILGIDPTGDVAMFRLRGEGPFPAAPLGDSGAVHVGDQVYAVGNPFMLAEDDTPTVTAGIVSATSRYQFGADARTLVYTDCLQIDASINPGNSGGPLFNAAGEVIGINGRASFERRGRVNVGLAYAITTAQIRRFIPGLSRGLLVEHGTLGAVFTDAGYGRVILERQLPEAPTARAGMKPGDRLVRFAGRPITSANQYLNLVGTYPAGWPVEIVWEHEGRRLRQIVELAPQTVRLPPPLAERFRTDIEVTREAARQAGEPGEAQPPGEPEPPPQAAMLAAVNRSMVKLYGGTIGTAVGYGTGAVVSEDGLVVTTLSLLLEAVNLRAVAHDGHVFRAEVVHRDSHRQLALLRLARRPENIDTTAPLGEQITPAAWMPLVPRPSSLPPLQNGDILYVVGNPFRAAEGDEPMSVTRGVLSGRGPLRARRGSEPVAFQGMVLLVDAVTGNPGAAGSAVIDAAGRWVGLVGENVTSTLTHTDLNYAFPVEEVLAFLEDAQTGRSATAPAARSGRPGYHGIRLSRLAYRKQLPFVRSVAGDSPAARAGLRPDDLIISANGLAIPHADAFTELCDGLRPGDTLSLIVKRGEELLTLHMTLAEPPER